MGESGTLGATSLVAVLTATGERLDEACAEVDLAADDFEAVGVGMSRSTSSKTQLPNASVLGLNPIFLQIFSSASVFLG